MSGSFSLFRRRAVVAAAAATAVLMLALVSETQAQSSVTIARCDDDGTQYPASRAEVSMGVLTYDGVGFCSTGEASSITVMQHPMPPHAVVPLDEWNYVVGINDDTPASMVLRAMCGTSVVCESSVSYVPPTTTTTTTTSTTTTTTTAPTNTTTTSTTSTHAPSPSSSSASQPAGPSYPKCSQSSKARGYAAGSTQEDTFPMDVRESSCAYTTLVTVQPAVGYIMPDRSGFGYVFIVPSDATPGARASFNYSVHCSGVVICADQVRVTVLPPAETAFPMCSHGTKSASFPIGSVTAGSFPLEMQDGSCNYTTTISVGPSVGTVTPAPAGLSFVYAAPGAGTVGFHTSIGYSVQCDGVTVCADMLAVKLAAAEETTMPPLPPPMPACSHSTYVNTHRIGDTNVGKFPLDVQDASCTYTATIQSPSVGTAIVMEPTDPMSYVYSSPADAAPQDTSIPYSIACNGVSLCSGSVPIHLTLDSPTCPAGPTSYIVKPGASLQGVVQSGAACSNGAAPIATLRTPIDGLSLAQDGTFAFVAPNAETDVLATVVMECFGEPMCQTRVYFVVAAATVAPATTTTSTTVAPIVMCSKSFEYDVPTGQSISGTLNPVPSTSCNITTYLVDNSSSDVSGRLRVNLLGQFFYSAPNVQKVDYAAVDVYCAKAFVCRTRLAFTAYTPLPTASPTTSPLQPCANVYYYNVVPGVALRSSLSNVPGQDLCAHGRYFTLNAAPQSGSIEMTPIGDFLYRPPMQEGQFSFTFTMYCLNQQYCSGTAYLLVSNEWTLPVQPTTSPTSHPGEITNEQIKCRGTCNADAWKTYPAAKVWDNTPGTGYARKDGRAVDGFSVTWRSSSIVLTVYSLIGNLGVRFPTFEPITSVKRAYMEPADFASTVAAGSPGFEMSCLATQGRAGMGGDVWNWSSLSHASGAGSAGAFYNTGVSWYQKFGGKHVGCDTFADSCQYAPLLTPANYTANSLGRWTMDVDDCDATWTGVFPYSSMEKMVKYDGSPVWSFVGHGQLQGTVYSEAVQASSWLDPGQFDALVDTHNILLHLNQFVAVAKVGTQESHISIDAEFFTYVDSATQDQAFGINMLVYPFVDDTMTTSYASDRHVKGFKWLSQEWESPSAEQCPSCTGVKMTCTAPLEGADTSYTGSAFPDGDCGSGKGRVYLSKGPATTLADCPENAMHVFNQSGFSPTRNCKTAYQNVTLRGIAPGSSGLTAALARGFNYEGTVQVILLMDDHSYERVNLHLSMYVSRLSKDAQSMEGELNTCRSGSYWPVLDPLGTSLASNPLALSVSAATQLCIDDLSSSYGPSDWALFTVNMANVKPSEVTVRGVYVQYNGSRVYLVYKDSSTGATALPSNSDDAWWQYEYPFLAFRDLTAHVANGSITYSAQMATSAAATNTVYAFTFIPGALGLDTDIEVVVEAVVQPAGQTASTTEFRRVLHIDPLLTQLSRQGPSPAQASTKHEQDATDLYAIGATVGVAVALVVTVVFFMLADSNRPLPKWVPRGKLIKETVLSVLPAGLRGKKKVKPVVHKDMYDAMNSGRY